jgi:hypothetical protein
MLGFGSGRNLAPLVAAGALVDAVEEDVERARAAALRCGNEARVRVVRARYGGPFPFAGGHAGALSTHALQHGSTTAVEAAVTAVANRLETGGAFYATLASTTDPRYAAGEPVGDFASAPREGNERGVPHVYYDEQRARALFAAFEIEGLEETPAGETAGRWAHDPAEAARIVHWFVRAYKR